MRRMCKAPKKKNVRSITVVLGDRTLPDPPRDALQQTLLLLRAESLSFFDSLRKGNKLLETEISG